MNIYILKVLLLFLLLGSFQWVLGQYPQYSNKTVLLSMYYVTPRGESHLGKPKEPMALELRSNDSLDYKIHRSFLQRFGSDASICDSTGRLLLYTSLSIVPVDTAPEFYRNRISLYDRHRKEIPDSELGFGRFITKMLMLPSPQNENQVYIMYMIFREDFTTEDDGQDYSGNDLYYSIIDLGNESSPARVLVKDQSVGTGFRHAGALDACLQSNGKDWWIVTKHEYSFEFYLYKLSASGIQLVSATSFQPPIMPIITDARKSLRFSKTANHLLFGTDYMYAHFGFDRCTGKIELIRSRVYEFPTSLSNPYHSHLLTESGHHCFAVIQFGYGVDSITFKLRIPRVDINTGMADTIYSVDSLVILQGSNREFYYNFSLLFEKYNKIYLNFFITQREKTWYDQNESSPPGGYVLSRIKNPGQPRPEVVLNELNFGERRINLSIFPDILNFRLGAFVSAYASPDPERNWVALCPLDSVRLGRWADERNLIYQWQPTEGLSDPTSPRPWASPARTTTYTLTVRPRADLTADCITRTSHSDTVTVVVRPGPLPFSLGPDRAICPDAWPVALSGPAGGFRYRWSTGDSTADLAAAAPGRYSLTVSDSAGRCPRTSSVELRAAPRPALPDWPATIEICPPVDAVVLPIDAQPGHRYRWADGPTEARRRITQTGTYRLTIENAFGCRDSIETRVQAWPAARVRAELPPGQLWCPRSSGPIRLVAEPAGHRYRWTTGETSRSIQVPDGGLYGVRVMYSESCTDSAQIRLDTACEDVIYVPTAFSPNGDGFNETWQVLGGPFAEFDCRIFDRWGRLVYETTDSAQVWDGGTAPEGVYTVVVRWKYLHSGKAGRWTGTVSLIR